jgi:uncharacterized cupredoxin-like copper-binding protein
MVKRYFGIGLVLILLFALSSIALAQDNPVQVGLSEFTIDMPASLSAGMTTFEITNNGTFEHNFVIEGQGVNQSLDANLQPGESGTLEVDLQAGDYVVYCPVGNHREQGMEVQLTVTEGEMQATEEATEEVMVEATEEPTVEVTEEVMMEATEEVEMMEATVEAEVTEEMMEEATEEMMEEAEATPQVTELPQTGGVTYPWTEIVLLSVGTLLLIGGLGMALARRTR